MITLDSQKDMLSCSYLEIQSLMQETITISISAFRIEQIIGHMEKPSSTFLLGDSPMAVSLSTSSVSIGKYSMNHFSKLLFKFFGLI